MILDFFSLTRNQAPTTGVFNRTHNKRWLYLLIGISAHEAVHLATGLVVGLGVISEGAILTNGSTNCWLIAWQGPLSTKWGFTYPTKKSSASLGFLSVLSHSLSFPDQLSQLRWDWPRPFCGGHTFVLNIQPGVATLTQTLHCFLFGHCALISPSNHRGGALFIQPVSFIANLCKDTLAILLLWISYFNYSQYIGVCAICWLIFNLSFNLCNS